MSSLNRFSSKYDISLKVAKIYGLCVILVAALFYPLIPWLLNYPNGTYGNSFQWEVEKANYTQQYILIALSTFIVSIIFIIIRTRKMNNWEKYILSDNDIASYEQLKEIRISCMNIPHIIFLIQSLLPCLVILLTITITTQRITMTTLKLLIIFFAFGTLMSTFTYIFTKKVFTLVLLRTYTGNIKEGMRFSIGRKIFIQLIPIFIVALLFTSLIGYSRLTKEKGDLLFNIYRDRIDQSFGGDVVLTGESEVRKILGSVLLVNKDDIKFYINPKGEYSDISGHLLDFGKFFDKYMKEFSLKSNGHVYDYYGVDFQGVVKEVSINNETWVVGIKYIVGSNDTVLFFIISFVILFILNTFVILYFAKNLVYDISRVAINLTEIADGNEINFEKKLPIISNDEIGDLVIAFNKIQQREKENIESIKENQSILLEQERLASLGQLIGGIAHNLKTPIMSIAGGIEAIKDLAFEYRDSIDDESVTISDHKEIAKEMLSWLDKMKPYCAYMSDVISAVKGQAVQMNASSTVKFTVDELVKRVDLLMKHELKKFHCVLKVDSQIDLSTEIKGEVNNLVQVFDNIIINAMQAYEGKMGTIDLQIVRSGDNVEFTFKDYAKGIPKEISDRLFKEMVTTKGKNGTGLGLYMSYSTIKGRFGGSMLFSSKEGSGTTFFISIPCIAYRSQGV